MDVPGASVFHGAGSLVIENATQRQEEEEFLAEEQHRNAELANVMKTAFDDLEDDDDDESSISSSQFGSRHEVRRRHSLEEAEESSFEKSIQGNNRVFQNHVRRQENFAPARLYRQSLGEKPLSSENVNQVGYETPPSDPSVPFENVRVDLQVVTDAYKQTDVNSHEQLQVLYDIRMREIERLRKEVEAEQRCKDQILRKLAVSESEKQAIKSSLSDKETQLAGTSEKVNALHREITALQEELKQVSKEKDETKHELDIAKFQILQQEQQIALLEKCSSISSRDKHIDSVVENLKEKHKREVCSMKKELDDAKDRIRQKEEAYKLLESRLDEVDKKHVAVLLNKCDSTVRQEAAVKALLDEANAEKIQLTKRIKSLEADVEAMSKDLEFYESLSKNRLLSSTSSGEFDDDEIGSPFRRRGDQKSQNNVELLKTELNRALLGQKEKRMTIRKLQEHIQSKEILIAQMREQEKVYLAETEKLKTEMATLFERMEKGSDEVQKRDFLEKIDRLEQLISVLNREKNEKCAKVDELEVEIGALKSKIVEHEDAAKKIIEEYMTYREQEIAEIKRDHEEMSKTSELEWRSRLEHLLNECDEIKRLYLEMRADRDATVDKLEEEKRKNAECSKTNRALEERIKSLKQQVSDLEDHFIGVEEEKDALLRQVGGRRESSIRVSIESHRVKQLREEIENLKKQAQPQPYDQADLEKLRDEVAAAKKRYLDLEATLKTQFETNVTTLRIENKKLRSELEVHKMRLEALHEVGTQTEVERNESVVVLNASASSSSSSEDVEKLKAELETLRKLEISRCEEIMTLKATFQRRLHDKIEELETKLVPHELDEIELVKEQVKTMTTQFYLNEMAKLRETQKAEMDALRLSEEEGKKRIQLLESELKRKMDEIQAVDNLKMQLVEQHDHIKDVKTRTAQIITNCAKEFEELKKEKDALEKQVETISAKSEKYKQSALKYKKLFEKVKINDLPQRYQRLVALVESKESEIITKIQEVAEAYQIQHDSPRTTPRL